VQSLLVRPCDADACDDQQEGLEHGSAAAFVSTFDGQAMDASLLLLAEVGFLDAADPRFDGTVSRS
jgi:GH15 family glucan-1,4-alpha-glucosidase